MSSQRTVLQRPQFAQNHLPRDWLYSQKHEASDTYDNADLVSSQVQFRQSSHTTDITNIHNLISSQVQNSELSEMPKILNFYNLWEKQTDICFNAFIHFPVRLGLYRLRSATHRVLSNF